VKFSKEILELQAKNYDAIEEMDMRMMVKHLDANMQGQVIIV
jgi:uridine kinase